MAAYRMSAALRVGRRRSSPGAKRDRIGHVFGAIRCRSHPHRFSQPLAAAPTGFTIQSPARIALDFPGVTNGVGRAPIEINQGNLRSVNVAQAGEAHAPGAESQAGNDLHDPGSGPIAARVARSCRRVQRSTRPCLPPLRRTAAGTPCRCADVDFRLGSDGAGRVIVDLANSQVGVDIRQQGKNLVVEFTKSTLPEGLRRRMDVADFGTPSSG